MVTVLIGCLQIWSHKLSISSQICILNFGPEQCIYFIVNLVNSDVRQLCRVSEYKYILI